MVTLLGGLAAPPASPKPAETTGFAYLDERFAYVWLNECLAEISGQPVAEHWGKPLDQVGEGVFKPVLPAIQSLAAGGAAAWQGEVWRPRSPSGGPGCYRVTLIPRRRQDGGLLGVAMLVADTAAEKSAAWDVAERFHEQRMWADLSAWFEVDGRRQVAHELRNRLMPMLTVAQMLRHADKLDAATLAWAGQSIEKKVLELSALAHSLQSAGDGPLPPQEPMDSRQLAELALDPIRPLLAPRRLSVGGQGAWVLGQPARLLNPLALCLLKAARHADALRIELGVESGQALIAIVGDPGNGFLPGQASAGSTPPGQPCAENPFGMGLMLAKMLVEEHGGGLSLHGVAGNPCQAIHLRLPLAAADPPPPTPAHKHSPNA